MPVDAGISEGQTCYNPLGGFMAGGCVPNLADGGPDHSFDSTTCGL